MNNEEFFKKSREILLDNMVKNPEGEKPFFHYTKPSPGTYPYQFFWDTCFHVIILTNLGEHDMAKKHVESLFALQREDGFVGHMIYWDRLKPGRWTDIFQSKPQIKNIYKSHMSALVQPPLIAYAVKRIIQETEDLDFLWKVLPKLKKYYQWLAKNRDFNGDKLLTIISPFESGMDWKPTYDVALNHLREKISRRYFLKVAGVDFRNFLNNYNLKKISKQDYFLVKDVGFNSIYAQNLKVMGELCSKLGDADDVKYKKLSEQVTTSILKVFYNKEQHAFFDTYGKKDTQIKVYTPTIFYPVVLEGIPDEIKKKVMKEHFFDPEKFGTEYPLPSVAKCDPSFDPAQSIYIWRGPVWIVNNWYLHSYLINNGFGEAADKMVESIKSLIEKSGFREYYNPFTGEGYGAKDFTWGGLVTDMIKMEDNKEF